MPEKCSVCGFIHLVKGYCPGSPVAQGIEHPAPDRKAAGSSPAGAATKYEKVKAWRKHHPAKYRSYMRAYMKAYRERLKTTI